MRFVDRNEVEVPKFFNSKAVIDFNKEAREYIDSNDFKYPPKLQKNIKSYASIRNELFQLFKHKCAYCEAELFSEGLVSNFRPINGAERLDGKIDSIHYFWLALDWENYYATCARCLKLKRNLFPVKKVGNLGDPIAKLRREEKAWILDPCWDNPSKHLSINLDGKLYAVTEKGDISIKIFDLNERKKVLERERIINKFIRYLEELHQHSLDRRSIEEFKQFISPKAPYSGIMQILITKLMQNTNYTIRRSRKANFLEDMNNNEVFEFLNFLLTYSPINLYELQVSDLFRRFKQDNEIRQPYYIKSVKIKNFKGIKECYLEFPDQNKFGYMSAKALIGPNAVGKTTILQAIALCILGHDEANKMYHNPHEFLSKDNDEGSISIHFWRQKEMNIIKFSRESNSFHGSLATKALLLGYGAYRLPARRQLDKNKLQNSFRVDSLFNERKLINGPIGLLQRHNDIEYRKDIAAVINEILVDDNAKVIYDGKNLRIFHNGQLHKLEHFSSGYQSIISFVTDMMDVLYTRWNSMKGAEGIVLIDELDAHLHPEWKFKIVTSLRETFPRVQFIFSTHDPLILRGMEPEEITILEQENMGIVKESDTVPPVIKGLEIDQILTSVFGLQNTMQPEIESKFIEYYNLLSKDEENLSKDEESRLEILEMDLSELQVFGTTKRERLMYHLIDLELAKNSKSKTYNEWSDESKKEITENLLRKLELIDND